MKTPSVKNIFWTTSEWASELQGELLTRWPQEKFLQLHPQVWLSQKEGVRPVWAQQIFRNCEPQEFTSIKSAQKALKLWGQQRGVKKWISLSTEWHRRTQLICEALPLLSPIEFDFTVDLKLALQDKPLGSPKVGGFILTQENRLLVSDSITPPFAEGQFLFLEDRAAPSRAYLKLWELFTRRRLSGLPIPKKGERCLDMGSSPGGWTWVLKNLGCEVISVDKAPLATIAAGANVQVLKKDAFKIDPGELPALDWFFSDLICEPQKLVSLIHRWRSEGQVRNWVCTIKFKGKTDTAAIEELLQIPGSEVIHLCANKHEVTWIQTPTQNK